MLLGFELVYTAVRSWQAFADDLGVSYGRLMLWNEVSVARDFAPNSMRITRTCTVSPRDELRYILDPKDLFGERASRARPSVC